MSLPVLSADDVRASRRRGETRLVVPEGALVTPLAKDEAQRLGIELVAGLQSGAVGRVRPPAPQGPRPARWCGRTAPPHGPPGPPARWPTRGSPDRSCWATRSPSARPPTGPASVSTGSSGSRAAARPGALPTAVRIGGGRAGRGRGWGGGQ